MLISALLRRQMQSWRSYYHIYKLIYLHPTTNRKSWVTVFLAHNLIYNLGLGTIPLSLTILAPSLLNSNFLTFPLPVFGVSIFNPSSPNQNTWWGALCHPNSFLVHSRISASDSFFLTAAESSSVSRNAPTTSPYLGSGIPTTIAREMAGWASRRVSISRG